jgi:hypothetical protein
MKTVNTWDELLEAGASIVLDEMKQSDLKIGKELVLTIRISGETWGEYIDYRGAQFVIDLQNAVVKMYRELEENELPLKKIKQAATVKVKVVKGSSLFEINLGKTLTAMVNNMTGDQSFIIAILAILCAAGYLTTKQILQHKQKAMESAEKKLLAEQNKELQEKYIEKLSAGYDKALDIIYRRDIQAPPRKLIDKMEETDTIALPKKDPLPAQMAKELYPRKPKIRTESGIFDDSYIITQINMQKYPPEFKLAIDEYSFWANAELSNNDIENLSRSLEDSMKKKEDLEIDLQLFVVYNEREFKSATIQGTGSKRANAEDLRDKIRMWKNR